MKYRTDLILGEVFCLHIKEYDFFQHYTPWKIYFFSVGIFFWPGTSLQEFFLLEISLQDFFFLKSPIPPPKKSNVRLLSLYVLFFQCTQGHVIIALENCFIQIWRYSCACITQNLWKDKEANFPETFIGKTKHQGPKLTILKIFLNYF